MKWSTAVNGMGIFTLVFWLSLSAAGAEEGETRLVRLHDLAIELDNTSGAIRRLEYPGVGALLTASADEAGLVDGAYPLSEFEPLRLAARHSQGAVIEEQPGKITIRLARLGASRSHFAVDGEVSATITLSADPDGRSIVLECELENHSSQPVRQVVFPELRGLVATAGPDQTIFKTCGFGSTPFRELMLPEPDQWYAVNSSTVEHKSGGMFASMWTRWMDLGGLQGGFSLFPRRWGWDPHTSTVLQLQQSTGTLRLFCVHAEEVPPGAKWTSGQWVLTPHCSGWAKGIEPYRDWVRAHVHRPFSMPQHIRDALGYRTVWMSQGQPEDPADAVWTFRDLPELAKEAREHGLREMVLWGWQPGFDASLPAPFHHLGTEQDMIDAVRQCRDEGVNVAPFISVLQASPKTAHRYGLTIPDNNGWTYHTELIPRWNPPYATGLSCVQVGPSNAQWQDEVAQSCRRWADLGVRSISWDQYFTTDAKPDMQDLTQRIRQYARQLDPESTFSGEELWNLEIDCQWLDYTWNWGGYGDHQAFVNAFPAPRRNVNINRSIREARFAFMDNLLLNVWPSKPDSINGSERIRNVSDLSATLKTCAHLRQTFLADFTAGILIGDCLLTEPSPGLRMSAYVGTDRVLAVVLNQGAEGALTGHYDLAPWIPGGSSFQLTEYDEEGVAGTSRAVAAAGQLETRRLRPLEMSVLEFVRH